jgi:hypothetical protein
MKRKGIANQGIPIVCVLVSGRPLVVNQELALSNAFVCLWIWSRLFVSKAVDRYPAGCAKQLIIGYLDRISAVYRLVVTVLRLADLTNEAPRKPIVHFVPDRYLIWLYVVLTALSGVRIKPVLTALSCCCFNQTLKGIGEYDEFCE